MREYVIIIGAMKAGTTTLFDLLAQHPAIAAARNKEPGFFAFDDIWGKGFDWYDGLFDFDPKQHRYRLEASTDYTKAPFVENVWTRMTSDPDVSIHLIYIVRDPIRRLESHARHVQRARKEIGQQISSRPDHSLDAGLSPVSLAISNYARQLDAYSEALAEQRLHIVSLDALNADPQATMSEVFDFLKLAPHSTEMAVKNAAGSHTRVLKAWRLLTLFKPAVWLAKTVLPETLRNSIKAMFYRKVKVSGRFRFSAEEERMLEELFEPGIIRLRELHGVDVRPSLKTPR